MQKYRAGRHSEADGFPMTGGSLATMNSDLMRLGGRTGTYSTLASVGEGATSIKLTPGPPATTPLDDLV